VTSGLIEELGEVMPTVRNVASLISPSRDVRNDHAVADLGIGFLAGVGGSRAWKKHRWLGFVAGHSIGGNIYSLVRGRDDERREAISSLGIGAALISGSLAWKKQPFWGGVLGAIAGTFINEKFIKGKAR
jgi:hypothetical protein